jgi:CRP-like cAMP-binding protein
MFNIQYTLNINKLFKDFNSQEINQFLVSSKYRTIDYQSEQVIAIEGEPLIEIGLVLDGVIEVQKNYPSGKMVVISRFKMGDVFGEVAIFSNKHTYPSTIFSSTNSKIMFVSKENILKICLQNDKFLKNLLQLLSDKILILDHRLHILSGETIRQKICFYLLERYWEQNTLTIPVNLSRQKMAEQFGITRPSLSRELSRMKREGFIDLDKHTIIIKDLSGLENLW